MMTRILGVVATLIVLALWWDGHRSIAHSAGVLVATEPRQAPVSSDAHEIEHGDFRLKPLAHFWLDARVLARTDYSFDTEAELAPTDLVLGWARMSDSAVLDQIAISQSGRWYHWYSVDPPIPFREIETSSANMHLIPATNAIAQRLAQVRVGQLISVSGLLVEAQRPYDGWTWTSSLTREDTGAGSCELVWVETLLVR
jgi:hypothetical protein